MNYYKKILLTTALLLTISTATFSFATSSIPETKLDLMYEKKDEQTKNLYLERRPENIAPAQSPIIPKTIHHIWIGDKSLPPLRKAYMETWKKHHPDWTIKLWTNEDLDNWEGEFYLKDLFDRAYTVQEKADIFRLNIMYKYGGLYVDNDLECLKSFEPLHFRYKFYASNVKNLGIFASQAQNPIFLKIFDRIRNRWDEVEDKYFKDKKSVSYDYQTVGIATDRCQASFGYEIEKYVLEEPKSILFPDYTFGYSVNKQIVFCTSLKLSKALPFLQNLSKYFFVINHAFAVERWGQIRQTTLYNGLEDKINIKNKQRGAQRKMRKWIHDNIDIYFIGCR